MKFDTIHNVAAAPFGAIIAWFVHMGLPVPGVILAVIGVILAAWGLENRRPRNVVVLIVFNFLAATLGAPIAVWAIREKLGIDHPALVVLLAFLIAYVAHDALTNARRIALARAERWSEGGK
jgi:phosphatidylserine synthase